MDQGYIDIFQYLIVGQGNKALLTPANCKAPLAGYTRGEYKAEAATDAIDTPAFVLKGLLIRRDNISGGISLYNDDDDDSLYNDAEDEDEDDEDEDEDDDEDEDEDEDFEDDDEEFEDDDFEDGDEEFEDDDFDDD